MPSPFRMFRGGELTDVRLAYETWRELAPARDNAVLILTGLSPGAHAAAKPLQCELAAAPSKALRGRRG